MNTRHMNKDEPTTELYQSLQKAYDYFNMALFDESLPKVIFTTQRKKSVMGCFSQERWLSKKGNFCHEISINPSYVARSSLIELLQTLVHEMTHCWQQEYGKKGRRGYHNKEWATKMETIGLMPSATGQIGGKKTGEKMNDYPIANGLFIEACRNLLTTGFTLSWVDRFSIKHAPTLLLTESTMSPEIKALELDEELTDILLNTEIDEDMLLPVNDVKGKVKSRYSCPDCKINVWGKLGLDLSCNHCKKTLEEGEA